MVYVRKKLTLKVNFKSCPIMGSCSSPFFSCRLQPYLMIKCLMCALRRFCFSGYRCIGAQSIQSQCHLYSQTIGTKQKVSSFEMISCGKESGFYGEMFHAAERSEFRDFVLDKRIGARWPKNDRHQFYFNICMLNFRMGDGLKMFGITTL